jgi:hypothetical protein
MSQADVTNVVTQLAQYGAYSATNMSATSARAAKQLLLSPHADDSVSCNTKTNQCVFDVSSNYTENCQSGGSITASGSLTGTTTANQGNLSLQVKETINNWSCIQPYIVNGDPYVQLNGTFLYPGTTQYMTLSGGFEWGSSAG